MTNTDSYFMELKRHVGDLLLIRLGKEVDIEGISGISFDIDIIPQFGSVMIDIQGLLIEQLEFGV